MFGKAKGNPPDSDRVPVPVQQFQRLAVAQSAAPESADAVSTISSGLTIVGKIAGEGIVKIFGRIEGELHAPTVMISDGAHVEGDIVADELTIGGRVKGTIRANRVKLNSTAAVEGDIFHQLLSIEENARSRDRRGENIAIRRVSRHNPSPRPRRATATGGSTARATLRSVRIRRMSESVRAKLRPFGPRPLFG